MPIQNKPGQGVMFPNDQQGNPNRPVWRGSINIGGKEWELSAWEKTSARGTRYLSLDAREPYIPQQQAQPQQAPQYAPQQRQQYQPQPQQPRQPQRPAPVQQNYQQPAPAQQESDADLPF